MRGVRLKRARLIGFRNHDEWEESFSPDLTVLVGENAVGKTNVLEAIEVAATGGSFRRFSWEDLVLQGRNGARVELEGTRDGVPFIVTLEISAEGRREHRFDGKKTSAPIVSRKIPTVSFVPEDLFLTKGSSEERRAAIDRIGGRLSPAYTKVRAEYARIIRQRNRLLRMEGTPDILEPWNIRMVEVGAALVTQRARLLKRMEPKIHEAHARIGAEETLEIGLENSWGEKETLIPSEAFASNRETVAEALREALMASGEKERARGMTIVGPHRDDIVFQLDGRPAREFASQGQHRTLALCWKIAEVFVVEHVTGLQPTLLLDDVMSELDARRREALAREVIGRAQAIVTTANIDYLDTGTLARARVTQVDRGVGP